MIVGVYDWDYFHFRNCIPNLECGKLLAYYRKNKDIAMLASKLAPANYSKFFVRKDYDDGVFPNQLLEANVEFGGMAFSGEYVPLNDKIEKMIPDFSDYLNYQEIFTELTKKDKDAIRKSINSNHLRLSSNGKDIDKYINTNILNPSMNGIILHDTDLSKVNGAFEKISELCSSRFTKDDKPKPYFIGNKYPIQVSSKEDFIKWTNTFPIMSGLFQIQYNGLFERETLNYISKLPKKIKIQISINPCVNFKDEDDFLLNGALENFRQIAFLCKLDCKILLKYDKSLIKTPELRDYFLLMNNYIEKFNCAKPTTTLYNYCRKVENNSSFNENGIYKEALSQSKKREVFQYIRAKNYQLFDAFYQFDGTNY